MAALVTGTNKESGSRDRIFVNLVSRNSPDSPVAERHLLLTRDSPLMLIGRASKVQSKGFIAGRDNAWFENPVMSREHAELSAAFNDSRPPTIFIKDVGSFHGTFHIPNDGRNKETRVAPKQPVEVLSGDTIRFGTEIFRTNGSFPPCSVDVFVEEAEVMPGEQEQVPLPKKVTFTVPDDDMDDDDDLSDFPTIMDARIHSSQTMIGDGFGLLPLMPSSDIESLAPTTQKTKPTNVAHQTFIDLTSEPDDDSESEADAQQDESVPSVQNTKCVHKSHEVYFRAGSSSSSSGEVSVDDMSSDALDEDDFDSEMSVCSGPDSEAETVSPPSLASFAHDEDQDQSDNHSVVTEDSYNSNISEELGDEFGPFHEDEDDLHETSPPKGLDDNYPATMNVDDENDESNHSGEEDHSDESGSKTQTAPEPPSETSNVSKALDSDKTEHKSLIETMAPLPTLDGLLPTFQAPPQTGMLISGYSAPKREPSPSDAALFKRHHSVADRAPYDTKVQALGEKSGKHAYFEAREQNRLTVQHEQTAPTASINDAWRDPRSMQYVTTGGSLVTRFHSNSASHPQTGSDGRKLLSPLRPSRLSQWNTEGDRFINNPRPDELPSLEANRTVNEPDMTSAYAYQRSKTGLLQSPLLPDHTRRQLQIHDLVDQDQPKPSLLPSPMPCVASNTDVEPAFQSSSCKRSFDNAFADDETPVHPSFVATDQHGTADQVRKAPTPISSGSSVAQSIVTQDKEVAPVSPVASAADSRPSKKMRLAQAAACVALGGAAAFSLLLNTAPVF